MIYQWFTGFHRMSVPKVGAFCTVSVETIAASPMADPWYPHWHQRSHTGADPEPATGRSNGQREITSKSMDCAMCVYIYNII